MNDPKNHDLSIADFEEEPINREKNNIKVDVAKELKVEYLSKTNNKPEFPIKGVMMGRQRRGFLNLICRHGRGNSVNVIFLLDSGTGNTYLSDKTITALIGSQSIQVFEDFIVNIHGTDIKCYRSNRQLIYKDGSKGELTCKSMNILGTAYLEKAILEVRYKYSSHVMIVDREKEKRRGRFFAKSL